MKREIESLRELILSFKKAAVALSGGLDSAVLLAFCAKVLGAKNCLALSANTPYMMAGEIKQARELCRTLGVRHIEVKSSKIPLRIRFNPPERCYICKRILFEKLLQRAARAGFDTLCDGTNADDLSDYRPGLKALGELGVRSPFLECSLGKSHIRESAKALGLKCANKPAYACLLTRLQHGAKVEVETLEKIDALESFLRENFAQKVRARLEGKNVRIECDRRDFSKILRGADDICRRCSALGFERCSLDLAGYKQGSMNLKI